MNEGCAAQSGYGQVKPSTSPCNDAYDRLFDAQQKQFDLLAILENRLSAILRNMPESPEGNLKAVQEPPQSEVHGWLIASSDRAQNTNTRIAYLIDRLTV